MDVDEVAAAIRRAGYGVWICRKHPRGNWIDVHLDCSAPKKKWFGVLKRKLERQGVNVISHYGVLSQYVEWLTVPLPAQQPDTADGEGG